MFISPMLSPTITRAAAWGYEAELLRFMGKITQAQQLVARALATRPRILLLDEVLAGLNPSELRDFLPVLQDIRAGGVTIRGGRGDLRIGEFGYRVD